MRSMDATSVFLLCLLIGSLEANSCPPKEVLWPCKCSPTSSNVEIQCRSIRKPEELIPPMEAIRNSKTIVYQLEIYNSSLSYLPNNLFKNTHIRKVYFLKTKITHLAENRTAFTGLENSLNIIEAHDVDFESGLIPDQFRNLKKLQTLDFYKCRMQSALHSLPHLPELDRLYITLSGISSLSDEAFADFPNLSQLGLSLNKISELKRNMLPNPAKRLSFLDLSRNLLSSLPRDFFQNMPNLGNVLLQYNKFVTLPENPFSEALRNGALWNFNMGGNPLHCDCKLSWLGSIRFPEYFKAVCETPKAFSGKDIRELDFESLCHSGLLDLLLASKSIPM